MKKIIFIVIIFILGILVAYLSYNSYQFTHIYNLLETSITQCKYEEVAKIFGGCCDTEAELIIENKDVNIAVFNGTSISDVTTSEGREYNYEETYYIYFFNSNYSYITINENQNKTALIFTADNGNSYVYPFVINNEVNSNYLIKENITLENALLNAPRNVPANEDTWGFMFVNLTKTMVEFIADDLGGEITGIQLVNNENELVASGSVNLDFSQQFFGDISELITHYNVWLDAYTADENVKEAEETFKKFYDPWLEEFNSNKEVTGYSFPYDEKYLTPNSILWKSVGVMAVYGVIMVAFYIVFFHMDKIKDLFSRKKIKKAKADYAKSKSNKNE